MRHFTRRSLLESVSLAAPLAAILVMLAWAGPTIDVVRNLVFDAYQRLAPRPYSPAAPVRIIDIDEESLRRYGQWPWPRHLLAEGVNRVGAQGADVIGIDIVLAEPDRNSPDHLTNQLGSGPTGVSHDRRLAAALQRHPTVLGFALGNDPGPPPPIKAAFAQAGDRAGLFAPAFAGAVAPLPLLGDAASGLGAVNWMPDRDLIVRRVPLLFSVGGALAPALATEMLRVASHVSTVSVKASNASGETAFGAGSGISRVRIGAHSLATEADGSLRIHYSGSRPGRYIPFWRVMEGAVPRHEIAGKMLLIGSSAAALSDLRSTPLDPSVPGVEVHAELLEQMVAGTSLLRPDFAPGFEIALAGLGALLAGWLAMRLRPLPASLGLLASLGGLASLGWLAFSQFGLLFDTVAPALATLGTFFAATIVQYRRTDGERRQIRSAFAHYVAPEVVEAIAQDPSRLKLGGETRPVSVLFSDLRDFTARTQDMPAEKVIRFLNLLHTPLTEAVLEEQGTVDKYIGDGLMAFWNAPLPLADHVERACRTALAMQRRVHLIQQAAANELGRQVLAVGPLQLGIGISTGLACVGNMGSSLRFDYSCVGDTVNTAARLEPLTRRYGVPIIVSQEVVDAAPLFAFVPVDIIRLKGKARAERLYALHGALSETPPGFPQFLSAHLETLEAVKTGSPRAARLLSWLRNRPEAVAFRSVYAVWDGYLTGSRDLAPDAGPLAAE